MPFKGKFKTAAPFYPMPNTGTILDISAGKWVEGIHGQSILNGGLALFSGIGALPNMFKSTIAAYMGGMIYKAFEGTGLHVHDTELTMNHDRVERLIRLAASYDTQETIPDLRFNGLIFTNSADYDATDLFNLVKEICKERQDDKGSKTLLEIKDPYTQKEYVSYKPIFEFWDSLSGMKTKDASEKLEKSDVGTKETNMLAMNFNKGKSDIVEQLPDLTARNSLYLLFTAHVGEKYNLDPYKPAVRRLRWLGDTVTLKRIPENTTFNTGNFYVITRIAPLADKGVDRYPYHRDDKDLKEPDLMELTLVNQRGKYGFSNQPLPIVASQKDGLDPGLSNHMYLLQERRYGLVGNNTTYAYALTPDIKMQRTTLRTIFREHHEVRRASLILMEMRYMYNHHRLEDKYHTTPEELYKDIQELGYDWSLLLNTRAWFGSVNQPEGTLPYLSTMDLLKMRAGEYHPYWYPIKQKDLKSKNESADKPKPAS